MTLNAAQKFAGVLGLSRDSPGPWGCPTLALGDRAAPRAMPMAEGTSRRGCHLTGWIIEHHPERQIFTFKVEWNLPC